MNENNSSFSEKEKDLIFLVIIVGAILSIIGSGAIILNTIVFNNFFGKNKIWNRIIFFLSLCDLCGSIDLICGKSAIGSDVQTCRSQGLRIQFFFIGSALWTCAIAINIFLVVVMNKEIYEIERFEWMYHIVIWGICVTTSLFLFFQDYNRKNDEYIVGNATFWCWITNYGRQYRLYLFFGPLWVIFLINLAVFIIMKIVIKKKNIDTTQIYAKNSIASRYHLYLLVLVITWFWGTVNRIQNITNNEKPVFVLYLLHAIFTPLQGFLNSVVYFWCTVIKYFIDLNKNIQKEQDNIRELRRRRNSEQGMDEGMSRSRGKSERDIYDNYYVYNPRPLPTRHQRNSKCKGKSRPRRSSDDKIPSSKEIKNTVIYPSDEKQIIIKHKSMKKEKEKQNIEEEENPYSSENQQYEKPNEETYISITYASSITPMLNKSSRK
ncbi:hypothetical protein PIROE2DRAFT_10610 [Piromyces sp. E2]|nr:hypothetical protein PIROE2DRAFT_10610 [Piromyces sp. E2]|eukprot:OUM62976.1 hypothetical protein PIROE2DRAFT_10610 [Piromyces sp. E2]